jgi:hypothetical protein
MLSVKCLQISNDLPANESRDKTTCWYPPPIIAAKEPVLNLLGNYSRVLVSEGSHPPCVEKKMMMREEPFNLANSDGKLSVCRLFGTGFGAATR